MGMRVHISLHYIFNHPISFSKAVDTILSVYIAKINQYNFIFQQIYH